MAMGSYNRENTIKTQKWPYLSQKWSDFHSVKRILKPGMSSIIWEYSCGRFYWKGGSIRENTVYSGNHYCTDLLAKLKCKYDAPCTLKDTS